MNATPSGSVGARSPAAWLVWAAASGAALAFVLLFGSNVPYWDEWDLVPVVTGHQPITLDYLWSQHNEHRIPLGRLVYFGLFALTHDFRAGMVFEVVVLSLVSALLIEGARRVRGRGAWVDGVFALLLLNLGHADNLLWSFQIPLVLIAALLAVALSAAARADDGRSRAAVVGMALPMLLAPLCGAPGVALAAATGAWLLFLALRRGFWVFPAVLGGACWGLVALYFHGYHEIAWHPRPVAGLSAVERIAEVLTLALGAGAAWHRPWAEGFVSSVAVLTGAALVAWWWRSREGRPAAEALLAFGGVTGGLVLVVGWGRSGFGPGAGLAGRYAALSAPLLCWACLAWCRLPWRRAATLIQGACWVAAVLVYPDNLICGRDTGEARRATWHNLVKEVQQRAPLGAVAASHATDLYPNPRLLQERLAMLRALRLGPFSPAPAVGALKLRFPFVDAPLVGVMDGLFPAQSGRVDGKAVIVLHAEGELLFDVRPGLREVSGFFGLRPGFADAASGPGSVAYDGTAFVVTFRPDEGDTVQLFVRVLDPLRRPTDRGLVPFHVALPRDGGLLALGTRSGAPGTMANPYGDWGVWGGIELR